MKFTVFSSLILLLLVVNTESSSPKITAHFFKERKDMRERICYEGILSKFAQIQSVLDCAQVCLANVDGLCVSYFFNKETRLCVIVDRFLSPIFTCNHSGGYRYFATPITECPEKHGYIYHPDSKLCFKYFKDKLHFSDARKICHSEHGELVKLDTDAKMQAIIEYIQGVVESPNNNHEYFIGGRYSISEHVWRWIIDNSVVEGFYKDDTDSCCLELESYHKEKDISMDDTSCIDELQRFFCEAVMSQ